MMVVMVAVAALAVAVLCELSYVHNDRVIVRRMFPLIEAAERTRRTYFARTPRPAFGGGYEFLGAAELPARPPDARPVGDLAAGVRALGGPRWVGVALGAGGLWAFGTDDARAVLPFMKKTPYGHYVIGGNTVGLITAQSSTFALYQRPASGRDSMAASAT